MGKAARDGKSSTDAPSRSAGVLGTARRKREAWLDRGDPFWARRKPRRHPWGGGPSGSRTGALERRGRVIPAEQRPLTSDALAKKARIEVIGVSLKTPITIRSLPNKLCGTAKAGAIGRRRGPAGKSVGKPDAANPHVRFDERGRETGPLAMPQCYRALPRLYNSNQRQRGRKKTRKRTRWPKQEIEEQHKDSSFPSSCSVKS